MALRYYRNGPARALSVPLANGTDTSITVDSASGFPTQFPYTIIIDPDESTEEVCDVTAAAGNVLTITRGVDSTTAVAHGAGAVVYHGISARDPREANEHVNATTNIHGRTGSLVDTDSVQSIPGAKTFDTLATTGGGAVVAVGGVQTITGNKTYSGTSAFTGTESHTNTETHSGAETHAGAETHTGTVTYTNTETHGGTETHNGAVTFSGNVTIGGTLDVTDGLRTSAYTLNTDANGFATVAHGASFTPALAWAITTNPSASFAVFWGVDNITGVNLRLRFMNANGGPLVSSPVAGILVCVRP